MPRRAHRLDANQDVIVNVLCAEPDVSVFSLAGVAAGCPDLLVGIRGVTHLVEVKDGAKPPSRRTFTPDQRRWIERWRGAPVVVLTDAQTAREWVAFVHDTGYTWTPGRSPLERMVDEATGRDRAIVKAFVRWVNVQVWGPIRLTDDDVDVG